MANNFNDYDELLGRFESKKPDSSNNNTSQTANRPSQTVKRTSRSNSAPANVQKAPSQRSTRGAYGAPPAKDAPGATQSYKGGVYFSNPPRDINKVANRQKNAENGKTPGVRRNSVRRPDANVNMNKKGGKGKSNPESSKKLKNAAIVLAVIVVVSSILCFYGIRCIDDVLYLNRDDTAVEVTVQQGMTDDEVLEILQDEGLIKNKLFCKLFLKVFDQDGEYISGVYTLNKNMGVEKMIATMKTDYTNSATVSLTFPEGWTVYQIAEKLEANDVCTASSFISTLKTVDFSNEYDFIAAIPDKQQRFCALEGYIYPDTYEFYVGENASSVVRRFLDNFESKWTEEYQAQADARGLTVDEVIIMASILQKEAANSEQMPTIASVLYNRLDRPNAFPFLQCDSTEDYLLDTIKPTLTSSVEDTQLYIRYRDTYDTYSEECKGLPIGAIANPGDAAIKAALFPDDTSYLYFRHDSKGGVYYASSFAEHQANGKKVANVDG